jgi:seipin
MFDIKLLNFMFNVFVNVVDPFKIIRNYFVKPIAASASKIYDDYREKAFDKLDGSQSLILRFVVVFAIGFLLFCGAVLLYVLFYLMYMPASTHVKPVHMQYNKICDDERICDLKSMTSPYHSFPIAHLQLARHQLMMVNQPYHIHLKLEMPETPRNQDLGIFMICVDMKDKENMLKSHACRSTMLRYSSPWLSKLKTILFIPFYIFGFREETQNLDVEMFNQRLWSSTACHCTYQLTSPGCDI